MRIVILCSILLAPNIYDSFLLFLSVNIFLNVVEIFRLLLADDRVKIHDARLDIPLHLRRPDFSVGNFIKLSQRRSMPSAKIFITADLAVAILLNLFEPQSVRLETAPANNIFLVYSSETLVDCMYYLIFLF